MAVDDAGDSSGELTNYRYEINGREVFSGRGVQFLGSGTVQVCMK